MVERKFVWRSLPIYIYLSIYISIYTFPLAYHGKYTTDRAEIFHDDRLGKYPQTFFGGTLRKASLSRNQFFSSKNLRFLKKWRINREYSKTCYSNPNKLGTKLKVSMSSTFWFLNQFSSCPRSGVITCQSWKKFVWRMYGGKVTISDINEMGTIL